MNSHGDEVLVEKLHHPSEHSRSHRCGGRIGQNVTGLRRGARDALLGKGGLSPFSLGWLGKRGQSPFSQQPLDNDRIEPAAVELSVLLVNPDLSKAARPAERAAGGVRREDPRDELPKPALAGTLDERL